MAVCNKILTEYKYKKSVEKENNIYLTFLINNRRFFLSNSDFEVDNTILLLIYHQLTFQNYFGIVIFLDVRQPDIENLKLCRLRAISSPAILKEYERWNLRFQVGV